MAHKIQLVSNVNKFTLINLGMASSDPMIQCIRT
jgi:hypothetical protein